MAFSRRKRLMAAIPCKKIFTFFYFPTFFMRFFALLMCHIYRGSADSVLTEVGFISKQKAL